MTVVRIHEGSTTTPSDELPTQAEWTEAKCRHLMQERAALPNAWPHRGRRAELFVLIQAELDRWNAMDER